jgi:tagaturonate reductase
MYERFERFGSEPGKGFVLLPCELIDDNGDALRDAVLRTARRWALGNAFVDWIEKSNVFTNTLVDRIVTGYPRAEGAAIQAELGYEDPLLDVAEPFGLWVIQGPAGLAAELPLGQPGHEVIFTDDAKPYKLRKVRMLNGAHTVTALGAYLAGLDTVGECMGDPGIRGYLLRALRQEIMPTLALPKAELEAFADAVIQRFENPFNRHELLSISLNSVSKFRARVLPTLRDVLQSTGHLPPVLTVSLAALIAFYRGRLVGEAFFGTRAGADYPIVDDPAVIAFFAQRTGADAPTLVHDTLANQAFWGEDLTQLPGLEAAVLQALGDIDTQGMGAAMRALSV